MLKQVARAYPGAKTIHLVLDNLNTHREKTLKAVFGPVANACLLTVDEFNRSAEGGDFPITGADPDFPRASDVAKERSALLKTLVDEKFFADYP